MTTMTYEEALKKWLVSVHGNYKITFSLGYLNRIKILETTVGEAIDLDKPVTLEFNYEEGYHYSEYTMGDASFDITVRYQIKRDTFDDMVLHEDQTYRRLELVSNEDFDLGNLIKEIIEIGNT